MFRGPPAAYTPAPNGTLQVVPFGALDPAQSKVIGSTMTGYGTARSATLNPASVTIGGQERTAHQQSGGYVIPGLEALYGFVKVLPGNWKNRGF